MNIERAATAACSIGGCFWFMEAETSCATDFSPVYLRDWPGMFRLRFCSWQLLIEWRLVLTQSWQAISGPVQEIYLFRACFESIFRVLRYVLYCNKFNIKALFRLTRIGHREKCFWREISSCTDCMRRQTDKGNIGANNFPMLSIMTRSAFPLRRTAVMRCLIELSALWLIGRHFWCFFVGAYDVPLFHTG
jgi:hypothetical protein